MKELRSSTRIMMKARTLLTGLCACVLLATLTPHAFAQAAPGYFADANHPAGAPDPEKLDAIWSVDPISDQVTSESPSPQLPREAAAPNCPLPCSTIPRRPSPSRAPASLDWVLAPPSISSSGRTSRLLPRHPFPVLPVPGPPQDPTFTALPTILRLLMANTGTFNQGVNEGQNNRNASKPRLHNKSPMRPGARITTTG